MHDDLYMSQIAPRPEALYSLIKRLTFKPGWTFHLRDMERGQGSEGLTLVITVAGPNSYEPQTQIHVNHYMIVPAAAYDERAWRRWLFDQCILVETHEAMEFFKIDESRPFAPNHGDGRDPYTVHERGTENDAYMLTSGQKNTNRV